MKVVTDILDSLEWKIAHMSHNYFGALFMSLALSKLEIFNFRVTLPPTRQSGHSICV